MKQFGSGHFGQWITDEKGLPCYRYTCKQDTDQAAQTPTNPLWRDGKDHTFQFGNDRIIAVASNNGILQVRQDENAPKLLQDIDPAEGCFGGGIGYLTCGTEVLCTGYDFPHDSFERDYGIGYVKKDVTRGSLSASQRIFAPYGDDPVLISQTTVTNASCEPKSYRWFEYWGARPYPLSFRALMLSLGDKKSSNLESLINNPAKNIRRETAEKYEHRFSQQDNTLSHTMTFGGWSLVEKGVWTFVQKKFRPLADTAKNASLYVGELDDTEDLDPPPQFLSAVPSCHEGFLTNGKKFFGSGGLKSPAGIGEPKFGKMKLSDNAMIALSSFTLAPGEKKTLTYVYGYVPEGFSQDRLLEKYSGDFDALFDASCQAWKQNRISLVLPGQEWIDRELTWHHHALRSAQSYDPSFGEHILSQGHLYQYIMGFQGAARDPLQHVMPFIFTDPDLVRQVIRYTCKEMLPDGEIPYGICGRGQIMLSPILSSDFELWLLWTASEYVLAHKDGAFLRELVEPYAYRGVKQEKETLLALLRRCLRHFMENTGRGENGLPHLLGGDWNDNIVVGSISQEQHALIRQQGESVLVGAMAATVLDRFSDMLEWAGEDSSKEREYVASLKSAVAACWNGRWLKRAYLSSELGWVGDDMLWLEPQPWALMCGAVPQPEALLENISQLVQKPSPIGAMISSQCPPQMKTPKGTVTNGGVWPSINGTLILALAQRDMGAAWEEWKKNTLAYHAQAYPNSWEGIWSGPDTYNSVLADTPGRAYSEPEQAKREQVLNWSDYPVYNLHPHAWTLYNAAALFVQSFTKQGAVFSLAFPGETYEFNSPLAGLARSAGGFRGHYAPSEPGEYSVTLKDAQAGSLTVNGSPCQGLWKGSDLTFTGKCSPGQPLTFALAL